MGVRTFILIFTFFQDYETSRLKVHLPLHSTRATLVEDGHGGVDVAIKDGP